MTLHKLAPLTGCLERIEIDNWFSLGISDVTLIAAEILGRPPKGHWTREGSEFAIVAGSKLGAAAWELEREMAELSRDTRQILGDGNVQDVVRAAAYFHLRFEHIHPLLEGNGRVGRLILAAQLGKSLGFPVVEIVIQLDESEMDYRAVFGRNTAEIMYELLTDLLARMVGCVLSGDAGMLPRNIEPVYPDRRSLKSVLRLREAGNLRQRARI